MDTTRLMTWNHRAPARWKARCPEVADTVDRADILPGFGLEIAERCSA